MTEQSCAACGAAADPGAAFCEECGSPLGRPCASCGAALKPGKKFCASCGAPATAADDASPGATSVGLPAAPVAERRIVSLLFADLVGFTPLAEARDPESVREILSTYFDRAREVIERYGGVVEKFIGDAVFAVWGVPVAREDDAERAVRAGLDLISTVTALGDELGAEGLQMRVGITTGQVAVTLGAVGEGMVAGDAVNTASRVQSVATPGQVWVDDTTRSLTTSSLAYTPMGSHELKGKAVPVDLFHAVRTTAVLGGDQRVDGLEAPFVGRDRELRLVKELFHATAEDGRARLVLVAGEPGIGKSRLAWEFEKYADAITTQITHWLRGRCLAYGQGVAGRVVAEMVRSLLRVTEVDGIDVVATALDERLTRHVADAEEREVLRPRLESLLGLSDRTFDPADLFACWRAFLEALTVDGSSVTLVVEDLQWADDGFLDFLDYLLDAARAPIMVLALARPEVTERRAGIGSGRRSTSVFLEPLSDAVMGTLLDGLVDDLPEAMRAELVRRAEGVPLYAVETVRALVDRDVVVPAGGRYVVDPEAAGALDLAALGPPASLQALLAARLDALSPDERRVVQDASVLGLSFTRPGIEALIPATVDLDAALSGLRRKEILTVDTDPRSPERGQFRFMQALLRTVAYDTLSRRDRHARHLAAVSYLSSLPEADTISSVLAAHCLDALDAFPDAPDAEELHERAVALLEGAAERALSVGAPSDALKHYRQLLALDLSDPTLVRVTVAASGLAATVAARVESSLEWVERGTAAAKRLGDENLQLELQLNHCLVLQALNDMEQLRVQAQAVFDASLDRPDRVHYLAQAAAHLGICAQNLGDLQLAATAAMAALPHIEKFGGDLDFERLLNAISSWFGLAGYRRMTALVRRASAGMFDPRDPKGLQTTLNLAAVILSDDPAEARRAARSAYDRADELGIAGPRLSAVAHLVTADVVTGHWDEAAGLVATRRAEGASDRFDWEAYVVAASALLAWGRGDASLLLPEVAAARTAGDLVAEGWWHMRAGVDCGLRGDLAQAAEHAVAAVDRMIDLTPSVEDLPPAFALAVDVLLAAGETAPLERLTTTLEELPLGQRFRLLHGQLERARAHLAADPAPGLRAAIEVFDQMGAVYWAARTRVELAAVLSGIGAPEASLLLDAAEPTLTSIGAHPALAEVARLRQSLAVVAG